MHYFALFYLIFGIFYGNSCSHAPRVVQIFFQNARNYKFRFWLKNSEQYWNWRGNQILLYQNQKNIQNKIKFLLKILALSWFYCKLFPNYHDKRTKVSSDESKKCFNRLTRLNFSSVFLFYIIIFFAMIRIWVIKPCGWSHFLIIAKKNKLLKNKAHIKQTESYEFQT